MDDGKPKRKYTRGKLKEQGNNLFYTCASVINSERILAALPHKAYLVPKEILLHPSFQFLCDMEKRETIKRILEKR
jgi:hypothetical protein